MLRREFGVSTAPISFQSKGDPALQPWSPELRRQPINYSNKAFKNPGATRPHLDVQSTAVILDRSHRAVRTLTSAEVAFSYTYITCKLENFDSDRLGNLCTSLHPQPD